MKSVSLLSTLVVAGLLTTACGNKNDKRAVPTSVNTAEEKVESAEGLFLADLTTGSWVSECDANNVRGRITFQKGTNVMFTSEEKCDQESTQLPTAFWYELSQLSENGMHLQISEYKEQSSGPRQVAIGKGKAIQALTVKLDGDKMTFVGLISDRMMDEGFPMEYTRLVEEPVTEETK